MGVVTDIVSILSIFLGYRSILYCFMFLKYRQSLIVDRNLFNCLDLHILALVLHPICLVSTDALQIVHLRIFCHLLRRYCCYNYSAAELVYETTLRIFGPIT